MKNKILFLGSLCLVMVIGLVFVGCQNEVQVVEFASSSAPKNVTAVWVDAVTTSPTKDAHIKVTWDVVGDDTEYTVVYQQEGRKSYERFWSYTRVNYVSTNGSVIDLDKYEAEVSDYLPPKGTYKIGVYASSNRNDKNHSKPTWAPATVTVK